MSKRWKMSEMPITNEKFFIGMVACLQNLKLSD
nr:MAG TPA: hypothetical protein [Caudoviricetes sp.]